MEARVYTLAPVTPQLKCSVECLSTVNDILFIGTKDGKVLVYKVHITEGGVNTTPVAAITTNTKGPVRSVHVISPKNLIIVISADSIVVYKVQGLFQSQSNSEVYGASEITRVGGIKDVVSTAAKKYKDVVNLYVLLSKKILVFEYNERISQLSQTQVVNLPDRADSLVIVQKSVFVNLRQGCAVLDVNSGHLEILDANIVSTSSKRSICELYPAPEVLLVNGRGDNMGLRLLPDGSSVPGNSATIAFNHPPASLYYDHPFLIACHSSGTELEIRAPLLGNLDQSSNDSAVSASLTAPVQCVHHSVPLKKIGGKSYLDYDGNSLKGRNPSGEKQLLNSNPLIAVVDSNSQLFVLVRSSLPNVVTELARKGCPHKATLLSQLCPNDVDVTTKKECFAFYGIHEYENKRFASFEKVLIESGVDPLFFISCFLGNSVPQNVDISTETKSLLRVCKKEGVIVSEAVPFFIRYLRFARSQASSRSDTALLGVINFSLLLCLVKSKNEEELLVFLRNDATDQFIKEKAIPVLLENRLWITLTRIYFDSNLHEEALFMLYSVATHSSAELLKIASGNVNIREGNVCEMCEQLRKLGDLLKNVNPSSIVTNEESFLTFRQIEELLHKSSSQGMQASNMEADKESLAAVLTALLYLRFLDINDVFSLGVFKQHENWLLGCLPVRLSVLIFTTGDKFASYSKTLNLIQSYTESTFSHSKKEILVEYLFLLVSNPEVECTDVKVHDACWQNASVLAFGEPDKANYLEEYKPKLDAFLESSLHINLGDAKVFYEEDFYRNKCIDERGIVYRRLGLHSEALEMYFVSLRNVESAKRYVFLCAKNGDTAACNVLIKLMLAPSENETYLNDVLEILRSIGTINALSILPDLPEAVALPSLHTFLLNSFRKSQLMTLQNNMHSELLAATERHEQVSLARLKSSHFIVDQNSVCAFCGKKLRPDTAIAYYPNGTMVHEACVASETVCPVSQYDFTEGLQNRVL